MNTEQLERERKTALLKIVILGTAIVCSVLGIICQYGYAGAPSKDLFWVCVILFVVLMCCFEMVIKDFEVKIKKNMLPMILQEIAGNKGKIKWTNMNSSDSGSKTESEKLTEKFEKELPKQNINKRVFERLEILIDKKENLSEAEKQELNKLNTLCEKDYAENIDNSIIWCTNKLQELQNKICNKVKPSEEDLAHIDFCEKKLQYFKDEKKHLSLESDTTLNAGDLEIVRKHFEAEEKNLTSMLDSMVDLTVSFNLFNRFCTYDDMFYGTYLNTEFAVQECSEVDVCGKSRSVFLKGNVIKIKCNIEYKNKLVIKENHFVCNSGWEGAIKKGLKQLKLEIPLNNKKKVFTKGVQGIEKILTSEFISFVNNLDKKYSYAFVEGDLYIIYDTKRDYFKLGSVFKNINDPKQYEKFNQDMMEVLNIVELVGKLKFVNKNIVASNR